MLIRNTEPVVVENVQPIVERTTYVERGAWYSEPWAIAMLIGIFAALGLIAYFVAFAPSTSSSSVSTTNITREITPAAAPASSAPIIVNAPAPKAATTKTKTSTKITNIPPNPTISIPARTNPDEPLNTTPNSTSDNNSSDSNSSNDSNSSSSDKGSSSDSNSQSGGSNSSPNSNNSGN